MRATRLLTAMIGPVLACGVAALASAPVVGAEPAASTEAGQVQSAGAHDRLVLTNGKVIEGTILSETADEVEILAIFKGGIKAPAKYKKSEILDIQRAKKADGAPAPTPAPAAAEKAAEKPKDAAPGSITAGPKVYLMELKGDFGWDISKTSLQKAMDDAIAQDPSVIIMKMNCGTRQKGFDGLWTSEDLGPIVEKVIGDGRRVVFWIEKAESGAAFLPFVSPEIYFTSEGKLGGVGDLSDFDIGDKLVNEKQISLRLGHAEGFAVKGGYDPVLIRAMARRELWFAWKLVGGKPAFITHEPRPEDGEGWTILSDDGEGDNKDEFSFEGNDVLNLNAEVAFNVDVSDGTYDTLDDLVYALKIGRDYEVVKGTSERVLKDWAQRIEKAKDDLERLRKELEEPSVPQRDARAALGYRKRILEQARGILSTYAEVLDPDGQQRSQIDIELEKIRQAFLAGNDSGRSSPSRGGGGGRMPGGGG